jgi:hypothetical protein
VVDLSLSRRKKILSPLLFLCIFKRSSFFVSLSLSLSLSLFISLHRAQSFLAVREIEKEAYQSVLFEKGTRGLNFFFFVSISRRAVRLSLADFVCC